MISHSPLHAFFKNLFLFRFQTLSVPTHMFCVCSTFFSNIFNMKNKVNLEVELYIFKSIQGEKSDCTTYINFLNENTCTYVSLPLNWQTSHRTEWRQFDMHSHRGMSFETEHVPRTQRSIQLLAWQSTHRRTSSSHWRMESSDGSSRGMSSTKFDEQPSAHECIQMRWKCSHTTGRLKTKLSQRKLLLLSYGTLPSWQWANHREQSSYGGTWQSMECRRCCCE